MLVKLAGGSDPPHTCFSVWQRREVDAERPAITPFSDSVISPLVLLHFIRLSHSLSPLFLPLPAAIPPSLALKPHCHHYAHVPGCYQVLPHSYARTSITINSMHILHLLNINIVPHLLDTLHSFQSYTPTITLPPFQYHALHHFLSWYTYLTGHYTLDTSSQVWKR